MKEKQPTIVDIVAVERTGDKIILPESLSTERAIVVLENLLTEEETIVSIYAMTDAFVFDGAYGFNKVLAQTFGFAIGRPTPGMFGPNPPTSLSVDTGIDENGNVVSEQILWGRMELPGVEGYLNTSTWDDNGVIKFAITGEVKKKYEGIVNKLIENTKAYLKSKSVYKGKAFSLRLTDDSGVALPMPKPEFLDSRFDVDVVFPADTQAAVDVSIYTPILHTEDCRAHSIPLKRGILLEGPWGVGKSLVGRSVMHKAVANNWTYIEVTNINDLANIVKLARSFGPAVIFCEDIDKVMKGARSITMDQILNIVDGVSSKDSEIMIVLTTNEIDSINQAMLRPGRLDAVIAVRPPDAKAVEKLIRLYGRGLITDDVNLDRASKALEGCIASVVREVVERSKLAAIGLCAGGELVVNEQAILNTIPTMATHLAKLQPKVVDDRPDIVKAADELGSKLSDAVTKALSFPFSNADEPTTVG